MRPVSMQAQHVEIARLRPAPHNPRTIDKARFEQLKRSLLADPEMLEARPVIALPNGEIVAGNMRWRAAEALGWPTIPTIYADLDERRAREWLVRDNNGFGTWQEDDLAELLYGLKESGSDLDLLGFESAELDRLLASVSDVGFPELSDADRGPMRQMTFTVTADQQEQIDRALDQAKRMGAFKDTDNENSNGNALARVCESFLTVAV